MYWSSMIRPELPGPSLLAIQSTSRCMLDAIPFFGPLGVVETFQRAYQVAGDSPHALERHALAADRSSGSDRIGDLDLLDGSDAVSRLDEGQQLVPTCRMQREDSVRAIRINSSQGEAAATDTSVTEGLAAGMVRLAMMAASQADLTSRSFSSFTTDRGFSGAP